jgi:hypothetical protein
MTHAPWIFIGQFAATDLATDLTRARWLAKMLDARFSIAGVRFGFDAIIGLVPGFGDAFTLLAALYPMYLVRKHGLPRRFLRKMLRNAVIDAVGGLVPVVGDLFDVYFKANLKNLALLEEAVRAKRH